MTWSAIYYAADGSGRGPFPSAFLHDLLNAGARYHLYFLLVSMQIYLLFPVLRWVLAQDRGLPPLAVRGRRGVPALADLRAPLPPGTARDRAAGGVAERRRAGHLGGHLRALRGRGRDRRLALRRSSARSPAGISAPCRRIALAAAVGVAAGIGTYLIEIYGFGATPANASAVFQPIVVVEAFAFGWALLGGRAAVERPRRAAPEVLRAAGSASSFGIYLAHPLVLQGLLAVAGASFLGADGGLLGAVRRAPDGLEVVALLFVAVPIIYAIAWVIASAARRTPFSLMLTGREYSCRKEEGCVGAARRESQ